jgi:catechol 2,3-dioxygenase-like lactoylglutathione lyase family enzyme
MKQLISTINLLVRDYDEAIEFYTHKLQFLKTEDTKMEGSKRWVTIAPNSDDSCSLLLAKATGAKKLAAVGNQSGGCI